MWAITAYYNPARSKRRLTNYRIFHANLGVPLVAVELSFDGHFELTKQDATILIQICGGAVVWQKERLLNLAIKSVPQNIRNISLIDCDVVFERPDWMDEATRKLSEANMVQLFSDLIDLDAGGYQSNASYDNLCATGHGIASAMSEGALTLNTATDSWESMRLFPCGIAWAMRREILEVHGLYDAMIVGGGDTAMVNAIYGQFETEAQVHHLNKTRQEHYLKWARPYHRAVAAKIGNVPGRVYHLWHGKIVNRNYRGRHRLLGGFDFDPAVDLKIGDNGAWHWARSRPDLEEFFMNYFLNRAEDE
jgi:hypothetical protein